MTEGHENIMDMERFEMLVERHGGDLANWPNDARAEAEGLLAAAPRAQAVLAEADAVERAVAGAPSLRASPELMARVLADAPHARRGGAFAGMFAAIWPFGPTWRPALALAAALILGVVTGYTAPLPVSAFGDGSSSADDMVVMAYSLDQGLEDLE